MTTTRIAATVGLAAAIVLTGAGPVTAATTPPHLTRAEAVEVAVFAGAAQGLPSTPNGCWRTDRPNVRVCGYGDGVRARVRELRDGTGYVMWRPGTTVAL